MEDLYKKLTRYAESDAYPFHMPGHKRNCLLVNDAYGIDITEIDGFDDLHHPEGFLQEAMAEAAHMYGSRRTFFMVNGSSGGILAAISALVPVGGKILIGRNCHTSAYNALLLRQLHPVYVQPEWLPALHGICGAVKPEDVEAALRNDPDIHAVMVVSPTYEGIVSDIAGIAAVCHRAGVPLIVDEAHGAHFSFGEGKFPLSALQQGADVVIQSLHKTLPAMTQTAILHLSKDSRVSEKTLSRFVGMFQTTSPSYVLMASILACLRKMQADSAGDMPVYAERLEKLRRRIEVIDGVELLSEQDIGAGVAYDPSKFVFAVRGMSGREVMAWLRDKAHLELEMSAPHYALAMTSLCDTPEGLDRLAAALEAIPKDGTYVPVEGKATGLPECVQLPWQVMDAPAEEVPLQYAAGGLAAETVYLYPPGIPYLVAGERVTKEAADRLLQAEAVQFEVRGSEDRRPGTILLLKNSADR